MQLTGTLGLAIGLTAVLFDCATARARPPESDRIMSLEGTIELMLLRQPAVQQELKLDPEEARKVDLFVAKQLNLAGEYQKLPADEQKSRYLELGKANRNYLSTALTPARQQRLKQIAMQVASLVWALDPSVSSALVLTQEQKTRIKELHASAQKRVESVLHGSSPTNEDKARKLEEVRKMEHDELMSVLTTEQKDKWKELVGAPFEGKLVFENFAQQPARKK
jgi:hypothetical protein